jgi:hypothetical protein
LLHTPKKFCFKKPPGGACAIKVVGKANKTPTATPTAIHPKLVRILATPLQRRLIDEPIRDARALDDHGSLVQGNKRAKQMRTAG